MSHRSVTITPVERDAILDLRADILSVNGTRVATFCRDMSPSTRHWVALLNGEQVGCASVMLQSGHVLRGMGVRPEHQRKGIGAALLDVIYAEIGRPIWCNARLAAVPFYLRHGWAETGPRFEMRVVGMSQRMEWTPAVSKPRPARPVKRPKIPGSHRGQLRKPEGA